MTNPRTCNWLRPTCTGLMVAAFLALTLFPASQTAGQTTLTWQTWAGAKECNADWKAECVGGRDRNNCLSDWMTCMGWNYNSLLFKQWRAFTKHNTSPFWAVSYAPRR